MAPMNRLIPWAVAALFFVAFVASFSELQRMRTRFGEVTRHQFHDHMDVRESIIRFALDGLDNPVVFLGDSLVEMADLPKTICGKPVVNGGVGGAQTSDFMRLAPKFLKLTKPSAIVIALGANDPPNAPSEGLMAILRSASPIVVSTPTARSNFRDGDFLADGIHLTRKASAAWVARTVTDLEHRLTNCY